MKYRDFEETISPERMRRYVLACGSNTKRAMALYRYNMKLSQEMYAVISCFEVSLRNKINKEMKSNHGNDWLRDFVLPGGQFDADPRVEGTKRIIKKRMKVCCVVTIITIPSCWQRWSLECGNSCSTMCNTDCRDGVY